jgi:hypothetical protein
MKYFYWRISFFLVLLFVVSLRIDFAKILSGLEVETNERRGPPPNPIEIAVRNIQLFCTFFKYLRFRLWFMLRDLSGLKSNNSIKKDYINIW